MKQLICIFLGHKWKYSVQNSIVNAAAKDCVRCGKNVFRIIDLPYLTEKEEFLAKRAKLVRFLKKVSLFITSPIWIIPLGVVYVLFWISKKLWRFITEIID